VIIADVSKIAKKNDKKKGNRKNYGFRKMKMGGPVILPTILCAISVT